MFRKKRNSSSGMAKAKRELRERSDSAQNVEGSRRGKARESSVNRTGASRSPKRHSEMPKSRNDSSSNFESPSAPPKERLFAGRNLKSFSLSPNTRSFRLFKRTSDKQESHPEEGDDQFENVQKTPSKSSRGSRFSFRPAYFTAPNDRSSRKVSSNNLHETTTSTRQSGLSFVPDLGDEQEGTYELDVDDVQVLETPKRKGRSKKRGGGRRNPPSNAPDLSPYQSADSPSGRGGRPTLDSAGIPSNSFREPAPYRMTPPSTTKATRGTLNMSMLRQGSMRTPAPYAMTLDTSMSPHSMRHSMRSESAYTRPKPKVELSTSMRSFTSTPGKVRPIPHGKSRRQQKLDDERAEAQEFTIGQLVMLHSLQNDEMNGRKGRVYGAKANSDRYHIALFEAGAYISKETVPPLEEEDDYVAIRPRNLRLITWEEVAADNEYETDDDATNHDAPSIYEESGASNNAAPKAMKKKKKKKKKFADEQSVDTDLTPMTKKKKKKKKRKKKVAKEHSVAHHERSEAVMSADDDFTDDGDLTMDDGFTADDNFTASGDDFTADGDNFTIDEDDVEFTEGSVPLNDSNNKKKVAPQPLHHQHDSEEAQNPTHYSGRSSHTAVRANKKSTEDFVVGEWVQLQGLKTETMNGREGYVYGMTEDRIHVVIDQVGEVDIILKNFMQNKDYVAIRPQNLVHLGNRKIYNHLDQKTDNIRPPSDRGIGLYTVQSDDDEEIAEDLLGTRNHESRTSLGANASLQSNSDWGSDSDEADDDAMKEDEEDDLMDDEESEMKSVDEDLDETAIKTDGIESSDEESIEEVSLEDDESSAGSSLDEEMVPDKESLDKESVDNASEESLSLGAIMETSEFNDPTRRVTPPASYKKKTSFSKDTDETSITVDDIEEEEEEIIIGLNDREDSSINDDDELELDLEDLKKSTSKLNENEKSHVLDWYHCSRMLEMESEEEDDEMSSDSEFEIQSTSDDDSERRPPQAIRRVSVQGKRRVSIQAKRRVSEEAEASSLKKNHFALETAVENVKAAVQYEEMLRDLKKKGLSRELICDDPEDDCSEVSMTDKSYIMDLSSQIIQRQALRQEELLEMAFDLFQHLASKKGGQFDGQSEELFLQIHQQVIEKHGPELKERDDAKDKQLRHYLAAVRHKKY